MEREKVIVPKSFYIRSHHHDKYGYTAGCAGCESVLSNSVRRNHTPACRKRFEEAMAADERDKGVLEKAKRRQDEHLARHIERNDERNKKTRMSEVDQNPTQSTSSSSGINDPGGK